jgi:hypothetical protein
MCNTITSVLGFDLDAEITDNEGNVLASGTTCNYIPEEKPDYMFNTNTYSKWTNFNEGLLNKIRDYRKYN